MKLKLDIDFIDKDNLGVQYLKVVGWEIGRRLALIDAFLCISPEAIKVRETKHGFHIYIDTLTNFDVTPELIVALQLLLKSDWKREMFNLRRILHDKKHNGKVSPDWNVLFMEKKALANDSKEERTELSDTIAEAIINGYEEQMELLIDD
ncbi:MAG: hypothetical protein GXO43_02245 [Crenarchaeota archaeon]|nr:hypothetical protein [Thermoproteota archaeon]